MALNFPHFYFVWVKVGGRGDKRVGKMGFVFDIFIALIALYLFFRLWSILGSRDGYERPPEEEQHRFWSASPQEPSSSAKVIPFRGKTFEVGTDFPLRKEHSAALSGEVKEQLALLQKRDPSFDLEHFLEGACTALKMILEAFATKKHDVLEALLTPSVYELFQEELRLRERVQQTLSLTVNDVVSAEVERIDVSANDVSIRVKFLSEQVVMTANADGAVVDNPNHNTIQTTDVWTFAKPLESETFLWKVTQMQDPFLSRG